MRLKHPRKRDDEGSAMVIAVTIVMIVSLLATASLARALSGLASARRSQDFQAALARADTGIGDALFRVDQVGTGAVEEACPAADPMPCTVTNIPDAPGTMYTMEKIDDLTIRIRSKGVVNKVPHGAEAIAFRSLLFPFAIFGASDIEFSGAHGPPCSLGDTGCISSSPADVETAMGTNGTLKCSPASPAEKTFVFPPRAAGACSSQVATGSYSPKPPTTSCPAPENVPSTPCVPASALPCPAVGGVLNASIPAGVYRCNEKVTFPAVVNPSGGVVDLYIFPPAGVEPFEMGSTTVNWPAAGPGDSRNFRVWAAGTGANVTGGNGGFKFSGVMWAPGMNVRGNGCKSEWNGAVTLDVFDCNGNHLKFNYDTRLLSLTDKNWHIRDYTEKPTSQIVPL
jgi:hypothetical protein